MPGAKASPESFRKRFGRACEPARHSGFTRISRSGSPNVLSANLRQRCSPLTPMRDQAVYPAGDMLFRVEWIAPSTIGMIGLYFRGGANRLSQYARHDRRCACCLQTLCELFSIWHSRSPKLGNNFYGSMNTGLTPARP